MTERDDALLIERLTRGWPREDHARVRAWLFKEGPAPSDRIVSGLIDALDELERAEDRDSLRRRMRG